MELFGIDGLGWLIRLILGLFIGFCIGLTSIGGGVLVLPALTVLLKLDPLVAVGTTTLYAFLTKITALFHHLHLKRLTGLFLVLFSWVPFLLLAFQQVGSA